MKWKTSYIESFEDGEEPIEGQGRKQALKAYEDVRRCYLVIPPKARK